MPEPQSRPTIDAEALGSMLEDFSTEITSPDRRALDSAVSQLPRGARVYIAALPKGTWLQQVELARWVKDMGLDPVPHVVARNIDGPTVLDQYLGHLRGDAGVERVLVLGGDRDRPLGPFDSALQLLQSGSFQRNGLTQVALACYPEAHPRIAGDVLQPALRDKLALCHDQGFDTLLITQLCFDAETILSFIRTLRSEGIHDRVRVGVAGPAKLHTLVKYAMICGVGPSLRALRERQDLARSLLGGVTPDEILLSIGRAQAADASLNIIGAHFFTFAALERTIEWASRHRDMSPGP